MLRIDVSVADSDTKGYRIPPDNPFLDSNPVAALPEIWAFGLRNPWRFSFDNPGLGGTGGILIADVGQSSREEVNFEPAGQGGRNYGWSIREGTIAIQRVAARRRPTRRSPIPFTTIRARSAQSISGGFVYRGTDLGASNRGRYFFTDYVSCRVWSFPLTILTGGEAQAVDDATVTEHSTELGASTVDSERCNVYGNIASIDVDSRGELYLVSRSKGTLYKIVARRGRRHAAGRLGDAVRTQSGVCRGR